MRSTSVSVELRWWLYRGRSVKKRRRAQSNSPPSILPLCLSLLLLPTSSHHPLHLLLPPGSDRKSGIDPLFSIRSKHPQKGTSELRFETKRDEPREKQSASCSSTDLLDPHLQLRRRVVVPRVLVRVVGGRES